MEDERAGRPTRRQWLAGALTAGAGLAAASPALGASKPMTDAELLTGILQAERLSILAYRHVLSLPALPSHAHRVLRGLLSQDRAHLRAVTADLNTLGVPLPPTPSSPAGVAQGLSSHGMPGDLAAATTLKDGYQLLLDVEALAEGAYYVAVATFSPSGPIVRAAQALANEAQHSAILSELYHPGDVSQSVPYWYVTGIGS